MSQADANALRGVLLALAVAVEGVSEFMGPHVESAIPPVIDAGLPIPTQVCDERHVRQSVVSVNGWKKPQARAILLWFQSLWDSLQILQLSVQLAQRSMHSWRSLAIPSATIFNCSWKHSPLRST